MTNNSVEAVVFDLGNVLIPVHIDKGVENFNRMQSGLGDRIFGFLREHYALHKAYEDGTISDEEFLSEVNKGTGESLSLQEFGPAYSQIFTFNEEVIALLPVIKNNAHLLLLSNTNKMHKDFGWGEYDFLSHFERLFLSNELGCHKPDPPIYQAVEEYTGLPPQKHLFIDDLPENVEGATRLGWQGIVFTGYDQLEGSLREKQIIS